MPFVTTSFSKSFFAGNRPLSITSAAQLPNLEVNYDASVSAASTFNSGIIASGTEVTSWHNAGGLTSHDWNSTGGRRPEWFSNIQNGYGIVRFNNTTSGTPTGEDADNNEILSINPIAYLQSVTNSSMFVVYRSLSTSAGRRIITTTNTLGFQWGQDGTQYVGGHAAATWTVDTLTVDTNFHYASFIFDGSQTGNTNRFKARLDGEPVTLTFTGTVGTATSASASVFYGGCDTDGASGFFIGDIGELLIFKRTLSDTEILAVETFLSNKWAI